MNPSPQGAMSRRRAELRAPDWVRQSVMPCRNRKGTQWLVGLLVACALGSGCHPGTRTSVCKPRMGGPIRAIWVTRWDYKTPRDIATVMENSRNAGFNTVLFQVRGNGTVFYRSKIEPWAEELGGHDPGFDPLAVACREAHRRGLSLQAWVNVVPGWYGKEPPTDRRQLYWQRPQWFWHDAAGHRQPLGWYSSLNPCYPEVRRYLVAVFRELVQRYPIDGLHLDYIRFPNDWHACYRPRRRVPDYPRDQRTLALFRRATGKTPESAPEVWDAWRADQITQLVRDIRRMMLQAKPGACLSAAVGASAQEAKNRHFQDSSRWVAERLVDAVFPMNYAEDMATFDGRLSQWSRRTTSPLVVTGIMFDQRSPATVIAQIQRAIRHGTHFAAFAYNSLFERRSDRPHSGVHAADQQRALLRRSVIPYLRKLASIRA